MTLNLESMREEFKPSKTDKEAMERGSGLIKEINRILNDKKKHPDNTTLDEALTCIKIIKRIEDMQFFLESTSKFDEIMKVINPLLEHFKAMQQSLPLAEDIIKKQVQSDMLEKEKGV